MSETVKAPFVLTVICALVCAALAVANHMTKDTIAAAEEKQLQDSLKSAFGEGQYTTLELQCEGVNQIIRDENGRVIFDITSTGYEKDGQRLLIGVDETGKLCGVTIVSISDSPTQAEKVQEESFLQQFIGWNAPQDSFDAVSGATKSSNGVYHAVQLALDSYLENKEQIDNG